MVCRWWLLVALTLSATACSSSKPTARPSTHSEREAIVRALPAFVRKTPVECLRLDIRVSRNSRYARAGGELFNASTPDAACARYARNGYYILRRAPGWKIAFQGSDPPPCSMGIPKEILTGGVCLNQ